MPVLSRATAAQNHFQLPRSLVSEQIQTKNSSRSELKKFIHFPSPEIFYSLSFICKICSKTQSPLRSGILFSRASAGKIRLRAASRTKILKRNGR